MPESLRKLLLAICMLFAAMFGAIPATCQEQIPEKPPVELASSALKALIKRAINEGEKLPVPTTMDADAQDFMNAGQACGNDVFESDPWAKKRLRKAAGLGRSDEEQTMAAGMSAVGMMVGAHSDAMSKLVNTMPAGERDKMGGFANNLAGLPTNTPSRALRRSSSSATHVFYVLLGSNEKGEMRQPLRLVWRQTHGDSAAIASRSVYYVSDIDGRLVNIVEKGKGTRGRPAARLNNDDRGIAERFRLEKEFWLKTNKAGRPRRNKDRQNQR